ncbi:TPA: protein tyrosine phosphatase, partial [Klebsiella pneumoniae]|nr:protein tyrosine phosphatase [Klebsiella pneumoniae]
MFDSVLVVCTGNICRSPMGERILQSLLPEKIIKSAGVGALVGHPADPLALQ